MRNPEYGWPIARRPSPAWEEQAYIARMARSLVASLGADEATRCVARHHWDGLRPLVMAEDPAVCRSR